MTTFCVAKLIYDEGDRRAVYLCSFPAGHAGPRHSDGLGFTWRCLLPPEVAAVAAESFALEGSSTSETGLTGPSIAGNAGYRKDGGGHGE